MSGPLLGQQVASSDRPPLLRLSTAPACTKMDSELQWLKDGSCSRPPTPHSAKRTRLLRRRQSPMRSQTSEMEDSSSDFPHLPSLVREGSSKLSKKFSRRSTFDGLKMPKSGEAVEFDKLETLANSSVITPTSNHRVYGAEKEGKIDKKRISWSSSGSRFSSSFDNQKSGFLDFFRRSTSHQNEFDELTDKKQPLVAPDPGTKKSQTHIVKIMEPRSPRCGFSRQATLPEIERLIRLSQKRRETNSNLSSSRTPMSTASINGRVKALSIDK